MKISKKLLSLKFMKKKELIINKSTNPFNEFRFYFQKQRVSNFKKLNTNYLDIKKKNYFI